MCLMQVFNASEGVRIVTIRDLFQTKNPIIKKINLILRNLLCFGSYLFIYFDHCL
jgi:hypothetical protein